RTASPAALLAQDVHGAPALEGIEIVAGLLPGQVSRSGNDGGDRRALGQQSLGFGVLEFSSRPSRHGSALVGQALVVRDPRSGHSMTSRLKARCASWRVPCMTPLRSQSPARTSVRVPPKSSGERSRRICIALAATSSCLLPGAAPEPAEAPW